ncbi:uncharacterized protein LOC105180577 isoform X3 [Harpegnathos saltator]|uniref:uncharacterized protein LOC105180577 isoform X3 n=1 Tax=Harpegnathos saltator TaxID=610380 RepID=UPI000DBEE6E8|nr:uncharacterized protein LOC105180577 isoform X3 [Harpegnathos saltator]
MELAARQMETEVRTLKKELARTQEALKAATKRCRDLVRELDHRTAGHESERTLRDQQLSRILRALLVLEARLKQEQKSIRQLLCEKDNVIRNQQLEIAMLRRYTKNYIKCKRDPTLVDVEVNANVDKNLQNFGSLQKETLQESGLGKDIASLKCEIITRLNPAAAGIVLEELDRSGVRKTHSFAGSDISKTSMTSSENTDASIITTTTEGSPSLLSTEGFCEGESTDVSPGSTLNKCSSRCTPMTVTDSENETTMIVDEDEEEEAEEGTVTITTTTTTTTKRKSSLRRVKGQKVPKGSEVIEVVGITRTESKDDGMDCNFVSEDEEQDTSTNLQEKSEPIYVNACNETNERHLQQKTELSRTEDDYSNNNNIETKIEPPEVTVEDTSINWYSDPDEDRLNDDMFRHNVYRPNSNHNSVLECVNQILLRDMEEEENMLSAPRRFKHRGRIVRFQPARLSDIESVGSEMERRNSEESTMDNKEPPREDEVQENEGSASEDEFGMRIVQKEPDDDSKDSKAIPLVIIEPKVDVEEARQFLSKPQASNPPLKMERIEEKACLQMSTRGLTIARPRSTNLDYEDIESLPEVTTTQTSPTPPRTPPALPPKPQFRNNTLTLKKIPSPSFLIDEKRSQQDPGSVDSARRGILELLSSSTSKAARSLNLDEAKSSARSSTRSSTREASGREEAGFWKSRFNHVRSSFQARQKEPEPTKGAARVTSIVRHFEEFKIGDPEEQATRDRTRARERHAELEHDFDIRQNFEEFNLDECDLSDDPDRPEGDGSERLSHSSLNNPGQSESNIAKDNNNMPAGNNNGSSNSDSGSSGYDHFLEATGLSNKSILTPSRLLSNHKSMLKPKDVKYKSRIKATAVLERHGVQSTTGNTTTHVRHWTGPFV